MCVVTFTYKGSLRLSIIKVTFSSHTGLRFLWMVLLLNTSLPASLNLTYGSLLPEKTKVMLIHTRVNRKEINSEDETSLYLLCLSQPGCGPSSAQSPVCTSLSWGLLAQELPYPEGRMDPLIRNNTT